MRRKVAVSVDGFPTGHGALILSRGGWPGGIELVGGGSSGGLCPASIRVLNLSIDCKGVPQLLVESCYDSPRCRAVGLAGGDDGLTVHDHVLYAG